MTVNKYVKKPIPVEAVQVTHENLNIIYDWACNGAAITIEYPTVDERYNPRLQVTIETLEGNMTARQGDWLIKGVRGEIYPCRNDIFNETYEEAEETDSPKVVRTDSK